MSTPELVAAAPVPRVKCLLVDDREENLLALSALLQHDGVELLLARSGAEALELLLLHDVALALLDVQMPEMDGFELAELMRGSERTRHVPIVFVTAGEHDRHRVFKGYESGAVDFLHKPIEAHVLKNKANVFFELYRQRQAIAHQLAERTETLRLNEMFTAVLGHDLRGPLSAILMSAMVLERRAENDAVKLAAARIQVSGKRMSRMIEDLLDVARARLAGGIAIRRERIDLGVPMQRLVQESRQAAPERQIEWQQEGDGTGDWDADRLSQVASNLIGNALRHGRSDAPVHVLLDGRDADSVALSVRNAGSIAADIMPTIFDPFRGSRPQGGASDGLGIGLYIVQQIVHSHGGRIDVHTAGDETTFRVTLPRHAPAH